MPIERPECRSSPPVIISCGKLDSVLSREKLEEAIYGWGEEVGSNALEVHLHNLRRKVGGDVIRNVRGVGYKIAE